MNISPLVSPSISPPRFAAPVGVEAFTAPLDPPSLSDFAGLGSGASIVDISPLGQLLSAAASFQAQQVPSTTISSGAGQTASGTGFGELLSAAQFFVEAFNNFQNSTPSILQQPLHAPTDNPLLLALNALPASGTGQSLLASLAQVGINFQEAAVPGNTGQFKVDLNALQAAFNTDPAGTTSLLTRAFQALGQIAAKLAGQNASLFSSEAISPPFQSAAAITFDVNALAGPLSTLNSADAAAVNAALQSLVSDQALSRALGANPAQVQAAADKNTAAAVTSAAATPAMPIPQAATAESSQGVTDNATVPAANAAALPAVAAAGSAAATDAPTVAPAAPFNDGHVPALDPSIAAAIAAYRVGDNVAAGSASNAADALAVTEVGAVTRIQPVSLDLHDNRDSRAHSPLNSLIRRKELAASDASFEANRRVAFAA